MDTRYRIDRHPEGGPTEVVFSGNVSVDKLCEKIAILTAQALQREDAPAVAFSIYDKDTLITTVRIPSSADRIRSDGQ